MGCLYGFNTFRGVSDNQGFYSSVAVAPSNPKIVGPGLK